MHTLHIDHLEPFVKSKKGNNYLIVAIDAFTKFVFLKAVPSTNTLPVENFLKDVFSKFGVPFRIICDRGTNFTSKSFESFCTNWGIKRVLNATATPKANGQCERYNRSILESLMASITDESHWDQVLCDLQWSVNNVPSSTTGKSAYELLFGIKGRGRNDCLLRQEDNDCRQDLNEIREIALEKTRQVQNKMKERYDKSRIEKRYSEKDLVLVRKRKGANDGKSRKLMAKYEGPYQISKVLDNDRYLVQDVPGAQRSQKPYNTVHSVEHLKSFQLVSESESATSDEQ